MQQERYWSRFAADYDERANYAVGEQNIELIRKEISQLSDLGHTLELGCGQGLFSEVLRHKADRLIATDLSPEMVAAADKRFSACSNVTVEPADCLHLTYPEAFFDTVFIGNLLHVIPTPEKAMVEVRRVIKPDGRLIVISYTMEGMSLLQQVGLIYRYFRTFGKPSPTAARLTVKKASDMIGKAHFSIEDARLIGRTANAVFIIARAEYIFG